MGDSGAGKHETNVGKHETLEDRTPDESELGDDVVKRSKAGVGLGLRWFYWLEFDLELREMIA